MAIPYIHNEGYPPENEQSSILLPHKRNDSSTSGTTTLHGSFEYSHPSEPLLQQHTTELPAYVDLSSQQPLQTHTAHSGWTQGPLLDDNVIGTRDREGRHREYMVRRRVLRWCKHSLEAVINAFAVYTIIRYFLAFITYDTTEGQIVSLSLGICAAVVFLSTTCAWILGMFQPYLYDHGVSLRSILRTRTAFHTLASFVLFAPAVINATLLFVWKNSPNEELNIQRRCHVDIDVIWSVSNRETPCKPPAWGLWITLTFLRLGITGILIVLYHWVAADYYRRRPYSVSNSKRKVHSEGRFSETYISSRPPSMTAISPSAAVANLHQIHSMRHSSESTLRSQPHSKPSSNHLSSRSIAFNSVYSDEDVESTQRRQEAEHEEEVALDDYHEHFRALVSQITRETEEAIALASNERRNAGPDSQSAEDFYRPRILPAIGYDEFGRPYPPDESVPILNGYIRRMPTIESMGSREMGSLTSSVYSQSDTMTTSVRSSLPLSRPPTRANTLDSNFGSRPPSRSNSITAGAEILLNASRASEVGELVDRSTLDTRGVSTASSGSSYPSTASYYTVTNGSLSSGIPTPASH